MKEKKWVSKRVFFIIPGDSDCRVACMESECCRENHCKRLEKRLCAGGQESPALRGLHPV